VGESNRVAFSLSTIHWLHAGYIGQEPPEPTPTAPRIVSDVLNHKSWEAHSGSEKLGTIPVLSPVWRQRAGFALPLLYEFCEFFGIQYVIGIPANVVFQRRAEPLQKKLKCRYRRGQLPQRSFSSFRHRAHSWLRQRRICYKAEHTAVGTNLRFLVTNCTDRASEVFSFYNDRGECENRIEEFKNGFHADRLSCHRFLANAFRLLLHGIAYNLVNLFRLLQLPQPWRSTQIETLRARLFKIGARIRQTAAASASIWLPAGRGNLCSAMSPWL